MLQRRLGKGSCIWGATQRTSQTLSIDIQAGHSCDMLSALLKSRDATGSQPVLARAAQLPWPGPKSEALSATTAILLADETTCRHMSCFPVFSQ